MQCNGFKTFCYQTPSVWFHVYLQANKLTDFSSWVESSGKITKQNQIRNFRNGLYEVCDKLDKHANVQKAGTTIR